MKKGYLIKETKISLTHGEIEVFYIGKGGIVRKNPIYCEKWSKRCYAYKKLQKECREWDGAIGYEYIDLFNYFSNYNGYFNKGYFTHVDIIEVKYE